MQTLMEMKRLFRYLLPWKWSYSAGSLVISISNYCENIIMAALIGQVLAAVTTGNFKEAGNAILLYATLYLFVLFLAAFSNCVCNRDAAFAGKNIRLTAFSRILNAQLDKIITKHSGDLLTRLDSDANAASGLFNSAVQYGLTMILTLAAATITVFSVSWISGAALLILGFVMLWINMKFIAPSKERYTKARKQTGKTVMGMTDLLSNSQMLRFYTKNTVLQDRYEEDCVELRSNKMSAVRMTALQNTLGQIQASFVVLCSIGIGFLLWKAELISIEQIPILQSMGSMLVGPLSRIGFMIADMQNNITGGIRVLELIDLPQESIAENKADITNIQDNALECEKLKVKIEETNVLDQISFFVNQGKMLAVVGESGSGKSTFLKTLMGFYDYEGSLSILGKEAANSPYRELRSLTAYVPQECPLFEGSIYENIAMGRSEASDKEVYQAAFDAGVTEFVKDFKNGFDTQVGESGILLSVGQRQKISIARALLKDAAILLFDEITASIDPISEKYLQDTMNRLKGKKTSVVVAHRLSTIKDADCILVLDKGKIVEMGTHTELNQLGGSYARMLNLQRLGLNLES